VGVNQRIGSGLTVGVTSADDPTPDNYVEAVERFGATAQIFASRLSQISSDLDEVDGLLITGGTDINPARYGATPHAETETPDDIRDAYELAAIRLATERGIPVLMVCRGMQIANTAFGGTLHQNIPDMLDGSIIHRDLERKFETFPEHCVTVEPDSLMAKLVGETRFETNASHHQSVNKVGEGLRVVARTDDGIVEALERPASRAFWLGTQWHPERLIDADAGRSEKIFAAFITACAEYAHARRHPQSQAA
jgi:putative glutamine amidotransferase